ncbi:hypothetical protein [Pseudoalteromonas mariniglutinosa]|uniref:hypothetical protein n=1 Tax=Pseudoalteromonas mariniglutinosa TaxID=206042 RepID=UPI00384A9F1E
MKKTLLLTLFIVTLSGCDKPSVERVNQPVSVSLLQQAMQQYKWHAQQLMIAVRIRSEQQLIAELAVELLAHSSPLLISLNDALPQCKQYFLALQNKLGSLVSRQQYATSNDSITLQGLPDFTEPSCYYVAELVINPAQVALLARTALPLEQGYQDVELTMRETLAYLKQLENIVKPSY